jgi:Phospholipase_D-nuclease N-terminal
VASCDGPIRVGSVGAAAPSVQLLARYVSAIGGGERTDGDWRTWPGPSEPQPELQDASSAPWVMAVPEVAVPGTVVIRSVGSIVPSVAPSTISREVTVLGVSASASPIGLLFALYAYLLPALLYVSWVAIAAWDLIRREDASIRRRAVWLLLVIAIPLVGPIAYYIAGGSPIPRALRVTLVLGGIVVYAVVLGLATVLFTS